MLDSVTDEAGHSTPKADEDLACYYMAIVATYVYLENISGLQGDDYQRSLTRAVLLN